MLVYRRRINGCRQKHRGLRITYKRHSEVLMPTPANPTTVNTEPVNQDFTESVSLTGFALENAYPLELTADRFTALMQLPAGAALSTHSIPENFQNSVQIKANTTKVDKQKLRGKLVLNKWQGIEILILEGSCSVDACNYQQGDYIRLPEPEYQTLTAVIDCIFFIKYNQFLSGDTRIRTIETRAPDKWLPGPVDGIEIRPLHVFDTESIMLLRWQHAAEFRPNLNPRGEEILVVNGLLQNRDHLYRQYSWIRNPIEDWRKWHGNTGTLIYYKSGHFPDDPIRTDGQ